MGGEYRQRGGGVSLRRMSWEPGPSIEADSIEAGWSGGWMQLSTIAGLESSFSGPNGLLGEDRCHGQAQRAAGVGEETAR